MATTATRYNVATAYVRVLPSMEGVAQELTKEFSKAVSDANVDTKGFTTKLANAVRSVQLPAIGGGLFKAAVAAIKPLQAALNSTITGAGRLFADTMTVGARTAGLALTGALAAVGGQVALGGLNRALGINAATAGLKAMGYEGEQFTAIMKAAGNAVDGTAYSMDQSVLAARNFMAAGVPEEKLQNYLQNVGKLADMGTRSYSEISTILQSMAATGIVQGGDMLQLAQAGIPIFTALADSLGVSVAEVKKLGSDGAISFDMMNKAITKIDWDSALFAATDVRSAWQNVRSQLSKVGANLWAPIIEKLPSILGDVRSFISIINSTVDFNPLQVKLAASMEKIASIFDRFKDVDGNLNADTIKQYVDGVIDSFKRLWEKLKSYRGLIIGAAIGIGGALMSSIPLIGPVLAGLTPIVGLFAGALIQAYNSSEDLRNAVSGVVGVWETVKSKLFSDSANIDGSALFKGIGDALAVGVSFVSELVSGFIETLDKNMPLIEEAVNGMMASIGSAFDQAAANGLDGAAIADIFTQIIDVFTSYVPLVVTALLNVGKMVGDVISSDAFKGFIGWLGDVFKVIVENEALLAAGIAIAFALFATSKIMPAITAMGIVAALAGKIIPALKGLLGISKAATASAPAILAGKPALEMVSKGITGLLKPIGIIALVIVAALAAMAGIGWLIENTDVFVYIQSTIQAMIDATTQIAQGIKGVIDVILPVISDILHVAVDVLTTLIEGILSAIMTVALDFLTGMAEIIKMIADPVAVIMNSFGGVLDSVGRLLSSIGVFLIMVGQYGAKAGVGGLQAASGIAALFAAISGGAVAAGGAGFFEDILSGFSGRDGNSLGVLLQLIQGIASIAEIANRIPQVFASTLANGLEFGFALPAVIAAGITAGAPAVNLALTSALQLALAGQQAFLDANPLTVRLDVDDSKLRNMDPSNGAGVGGGNSRVNNNNYNLTSNNQNFINALVKKARGR